MVSTVRNPPTVVRNEQSRVQNPSNSVVDGLTGRISLMTSFMGDNPDTSTKKTGDKPIGTPKSKLRGVVSNRRKREPAKERVNVEGTIYKGRNYDRVLDDVEGRPQSGALVAMSRNGIEKLLDGKVGYDELLTLGDFLLFSFTKELVLLDLSCRGSDRTLSESTGHFVGV